MSVLHQSPSATPPSLTAPPSTVGFWLARSVRTIFFFIVVLTIAGIYVAYQVPISVFPETNFPRVVIGVDNGVMPVEQMQVTITKPLEDAVNSVPGLTTVRSTTSRGSAEVSLFFDWNQDMFKTLQLVDAALTKVQQTLPATAKITTNRLTFATFPILGYSLTSGTVPQTRLWEIATYELKPPLNRVAGVATVQPGTMPVYTVVTANGKRSVLLNITRQPASNTVSVADAVAKEIEQLRLKLPAGVKLEPYYDQSQLVRDSISSVRDAILIGLVLACIILFLFLRDLRSSIIAGMVIPITVAVTIIFLWLIGESFNLMTLGGLAAAIGLVIDDAIVVVENIVLHRDAGQGRLQAIRAAL